MNKNSALRTALEHAVSHGLTFAAFRLPGEPAELWAQRDPELEVVDGALMWELNEVFLVAPFLIDPERVPFIRADVELAFGEFDPDIALLEGCTGAARPALPPTAPTTREAFVSNVEKAKAAIGSGALRKVALSRVMRMDTGAQDAAGLFQHAIATRPDSFVAMINTPEHGLWIGASPERLVHEEEDVVQVDALAATMPAAQAHTDAAAWGAKERDEQQQVTDAVLHAFAALGLSDVQVVGPQVTAANEVAHLHTRMQADLHGTPLSDLVLALHPTPAVGGWPKAPAIAFIRTNEAHDRGLYTGFWGPWNPDGRTDLFVNIRCMRLQEDHGLLYVGAGITAGSDAAAEWNETEEKAQAWVRPIAGLRA